MGGGSFDNLKKRGGNDQEKGVVGLKSTIVHANHAKNLEERKNVDTF